MAALDHEQIRSCDWSLAIIELGKGHLAIGIDERLLINPSHALESLHRRYPYAPQYLGHSLSNSPFDSLIFFGFLKGHHLRVGKDQALLQAVSLQSLKSFFDVVEIVAQPNTAYSSR
jgi:hypothetical protein